MRSLEELDRAIRRIEDRREIDDLVSRFAIATDERDYETLRHILADDAIFAIGAQPELVGVDAIVEWLQGRLRIMALTIHTPHPGVVTFLDNDRAEGVVPAHSEASTDGVTMVVAGRYRDLYVRRAHGWRLQHRDFAVMYALPVDELQRMHEPLRVRWPGTEATAAALPEAFPSFQRDKAR
jgi:ketosteroid isomerase-like protein